MAGVNIASAGVAAEGMPVVEAQDTPVAVVTPAEVAHRQYVPAAVAVLAVVPPVVMVLMPPHRVVAADRMAASALDHFQIWYSWSIG